MPRKKVKLHSRHGRPSFDPIIIYGFVEAGRRKHGLSINAFCQKFSLALLVHRARPTIGVFEPHLEMDILKGTTLKRRFFEAKSSIFVRAKSLEGVSPDPYIPELIEEVVELQFQELSETT